MITKDEIEKLLFECINDFNILNGTHIMPEANTVLVGSGSEMDSMDFISLIVGIEEKIYGRYDVSVSITAEKAMSQKNSPFRTIGTLSDYILTIIPLG